MSSPARGCCQYSVTFIDGFSRYGYVYLMKHKFETFELFKTFKNEVQNQLARILKHFNLIEGVRMWNCLIIDCTKYASEMMYMKRGIELY